MNEKEDSLKGYPIYLKDDAKGTIEVLDGKDIYKFINDKGDDGRWQAVLLVKSTYPKWGSEEMQTTLSVRVFSWRYREVRNYKGRDRDSGRPIYEGTGEYFWRQINVLPINSQHTWEDMRKAIEEYAKELPE